MNIYLNKFVCLNILLYYYIDMSGRNVSGLQRMQQQQQLQPQQQLHQRPPLGKTKGCGGETSSGSTSSGLINSEKCK